VDLATAIPVSVGIIMAGIALMNFFRKRNSNPGGVAEKLCDDRHEDIDRRLGRGVERFDKIDEKLEKLNTEQVEQGKVLIKVFTIVDRMEKKS